MESQAPLWVVFALIAFAYLLGAIPFGLIIGKKFYDVDVREHGSGNPGATNVWRVLGKKPGLATLALDILKGAAPVAASRAFAPSETGVALVCGFAAIAGHNWSVFMRGRGGKGVATSAGVFVALIPLQGLIAIAVFAAVLYISKRVSVGSISASVALMISTFVIRTPAVIRLLVVVAATMILVKHVPNMKRLARGEEPRLKF
jgi:glycerol-3-phosphate acyltransferase PlsY